MADLKIGYICKKMTFLPNSPSFLSFLLKFCGGGGSSAPSVYDTVSLTYTIKIENSVKNDFIII